MGSKKKGSKALSKAEMKKKVEEFKAVASPVTSSPSTSESSPKQMDVASPPPMVAETMIIEKRSNERVPLRPSSTKIQTVSWAEVSSGNTPTPATDNRLVRPKFYLSNQTISKITELAQQEIPDFNQFGLDIVGSQSQNIEGQIPSFQGDFSDELDNALSQSNGHFLALAPIYGGGQGQRTEMEVLEIIDRALAHPNFRSIMVITIGNRGADYLSFEEYTKYNSVLNYSQLTTALQKSTWYRMNLVAKETEQLLSKEGATSFPLSFHLLFKHKAQINSGYITTSKFRQSYRRLEQSESLPQLTPGVDRFTVIGGTWRTLNSFGQSLIKAGQTVYKIYNASGDAQLVIESKNVAMSPNEALDLGMWMTKANEFNLKEGETILGVQKKGMTVPMIVKHPAIKKHARIIQPSGGCRISVILPSSSVQEFVREANTGGMLVFGNSGRIFNSRQQSDTGYSVLPNMTGDIEVPSIPISITNDEIKVVLKEITPDIEWVATSGTSTFNYSLVGVYKVSKVKPDILEDIRKSLSERFGLIMLCD